MPNRRSLKVARHSAETVEEARRLYEAGALSEEKIAACLRISRGALRWMAARGEWRRPEAAAARISLVSRLRRKVESEIAAADRALAAAPGAPSSASSERAARTLASLVRTLRELDRIDEARAKAGLDRSASYPPGNADDRIADLDAFRRSLAERLERLAGDAEG